MQEAERKIRVVLFSGGRGSQALSVELISDRRVDATLVVNGYDDGKSTGEVRRFLGDCLGPSDFRKNAARMASRLESCTPALIELLELRLPDETTHERGAAFLRVLCGEDPQADDEFAGRLAELVGRLDEGSRRTLSARIESFEQACRATSDRFDFADCSVGNIAFAGCFLEARRSFNTALADYCSMVGLPSGILENVTDGSDAYLVALDVQGRLLASEADIVDASVSNRIDEIFLLRGRVSPEDRARLSQAGREEIRAFIEEEGCEVEPNPAVLDCIRRADLIIYAPGTQHSSLFPSYMTRGVGQAIESNLSAIKLLITNLEEDADIVGSSAVSIIDRAVYYLRDKDRRAAPRPTLITHYLINDPSGGGGKESYIPLGGVESLHDPRLVRIGNYEGEATGRHDASKVLQPFIRELSGDDRVRRIAVLLLATESPNKISQTLVEMVRAGIGEFPAAIEVLFESSEGFDKAFERALPFPIRNLHGEGSNWLEALRGGAYDYAVLFESSGMYKGGDILGLLRPLKDDRVDAIWGSRRLSINDVHMAYRLLHRRNRLRGAISYVGSHLLSQVCLLIYGRYISDTISGIKLIRTPYICENDLDPAGRGVNFALLSVLLSDRAEIFETPVHYFPISPEKVRHTSIGEGFGALWTFVRYRFRRGRYQSRSRSTVRRPVFDGFSAGSLEVFEPPDVDEGRE